MSFNLLTLGFCKELFFISYVLKRSVWCDLSIDSKTNFKLSLKVYPDSTLEIFYKQNLIWKEKIEDPAIGFSIESIDSISKIIEQIEKNNPFWNLKYPSPLK